MGKKFKCIAARKKNYYTKGSWWLLQIVAIVEAGVAEPLTFWQYTILNIRFSPDLLSFSFINVDILVYF